MALVHAAAPVEAEDVDDAQLAEDPPSTEEGESVVVTTEPAPSPRPFPPTRRPYLRLLVEETLFLAGGATWYWTDREFNAKDWDYASWRRRFSIEALRFDNNEFSTNWVFHPLAGAAFHGFARANGFGFGASLGISFSTSATWEGIIEFREKFSINDLINTPGAGAPMGEYFHHLGTYLFHVHGGRSRGIGHRLLAWTFGLPTTGHRRLDRVESNLDLARYFETWFRLAYGVEVFRIDRGSPFFVHALSLDSDVVDHTRSGMPSPRFRYFHDGDRTTFRLRVELLDSRPGIDMLSDVVVLGGIRRVGDRTTSTMNETVIGAAIGFQYLRREWPAFYDTYGAVELFGAAIDHRTERDHVRFRLRFRAAPTFAAVSAPGYGEWARTNPEVVGKVILSDWSYYNAFGAAVRLESEVHLGRIEVGGRTSFGYASSIEGIDRFQEDVQVDQRCEELRFTWDAHVRVRPVASRGLVFGVEARGWHSSSSIEDIHTQRDLYSLGASIAHEH